jgi:hypothetical protein
VLVGLGMSETKTFSTRVLLSVHTGCGIPDVTFSDLHEAVEHLIGEPVWTHQLALPSVWESARAEIDRQCIGFSCADADALRSACKDKEGDEREEAAEAWTRAVVAEIGCVSFTVTHGNGTGRTDEQIGTEAMRSLVTMAGSRPVIGVIIGDERENTQLAEESGS